MSFVENRMHGKVRCCMSSGASVSPGGELSCFKKASAVVVDTKCSFLRRFADNDNSLCAFFAETAQKERLGLLTKHWLIS